MDIKEMKSQAYDVAVAIDGLQKKLFQLNQQISIAVNNKDKKEDPIKEEITK